MRENIKYNLEPIEVVVQEKIISKQKYKDVDGNLYNNKREAENYNFNKLIYEEKDKILNKSKIKVFQSDFSFIGNSLQETAFILSYIQNFYNTDATSLKIYYCFIKYLKKLELEDYHYPQIFIMKDESDLTEIQKFYTMNEIAYEVLENMNIIRENFERMPNRVEQTNLSFKIEEIMNDKKFLKVKNIRDNNNG